MLLPLMSFFFFCMNVFVCLFPSFFFLSAYPSSFSVNIRVQSPSFFFFFRGFEIFFSGGGRESTTQQGKRGEPHSRLFFFFFLYLTLSFSHSFSFTLSLCSKSEGKKKCRNSFFLLLFFKSACVPCAGE